ncbi:hypothetical protein GCM10014713_67220 [Streptomyces purpureus]|uniref:Uncharacterized protein n=1 Tax=Streptomyces purpureus TaxID=1951 RepID=A0A918HHI5_9ACTN|nr:hypothetical protein GCM10014713_67220 [Streptomyces purpureus]
MTMCDRSGRPGGLAGMGVSFWSSRKRERVRVGQVRAGCGCGVEGDMGVGAAPAGVRGPRPGGRWPVQRRGSFTDREWRK